MSNVQKIDHIGIAVKDMEKAMETYDKGFGLKSKLEETHEHLKVKICFIPVGEVLVEFIESTEPYEEKEISEEDYDMFNVNQFIQKNGESVHHIAFRVEDIDESLKQLKNYGMKLLDNEPRPGGGGSRIAFVDPESTNNILIELVEREEDL